MERWTGHLDVSKLSVICDANKMRKLG